MWLIQVLTRLPTTIAVIGMPVAANMPAIAKAYASASQSVSQQVVASCYLVKLATNIYLPARAKAMSEESCGMLYMPPADRVLSEKYNASLNVHSITTLPKTMPHTIQARSMHKSSNDAL